MEIKKIQTYGLAGISIDGNADLTEASGGDEGSSILDNTDDRGKINLSKLEKTALDEVKDKSVDFEKSKKPKVYVTDIFYGEHSDLDDIRKFYLTFEEYIKLGRPNRIEERAILKKIE